MSDPVSTDAVLEARGLKTGIMGKVWLSRRLSKRPKAPNLLIGKLRYEMEQGFGMFKRLAV
jgi:hypothetical protein